MTLRCGAGALTSAWYESAGCFPEPGVRRPQGCSRDPNRPHARRRNSRLPWYRKRPRVDNPAIVCHPPQCDIAVGFGRPDSSCPGSGPGIHAFVTDDRFSNKRRSPGQARWWRCAWESLLLGRSGRPDHRDALRRSGRPPWCV